MQMKTLKLKDRALALQRLYPKIDRKTRFLYDGKLNKRSTSNAVAVHVIASSEDGRVTLHQTIFRKPGFTMTQWNAWLGEHAPRVIQNQVRAYMGRTYGSTWTIEKIFGWNFIDE
jgi:hypothetical protein